MKRRMAWPTRLIALSLLLGGLGVSSCLSHAAATTTKKKTKAGTISKSSRPTKPKASTTKSTTATKTQAKRTAKSSSAAGAKGKNGKTVTSHRDRGQKAPTPDRVSEIQTALAKNGAYAGTPNGKWDDATVDAMRKFQATHGLNASGKLDARTLQQLGLGSQTAGIAPPTPSTKVSANLSSRNTVGSQQ